MGRVDTVERPAYKTQFRGDEEWIKRLTADWDQCLTKNCQLKQNENHKFSFNLNFFKVIQIFCLRSRNKQTNKHKKTWNIYQMINLEFASSRILQKSPRYFPSERNVIKVLNLFRILEKVRLGWICIIHKCTKRVRGYKTGPPEKMFIKIVIKIAIK